MSNPSPILNDLASCGVSPPQGIAVSANLTLTPAHWNKTLDLQAAGLTITVPSTGLPVDFECRVIPNGATLIASDGTSLLNGATTTLTRNSATAGNQFVSIRQRAGGVASFMVNGQ